MFHQKGRPWAEVGPGEEASVSDKTFQEIQMASQQWQPAVWGLPGPTSNCPPVRPLGCEDEKPLLRFSLASHAPPTNEIFIAGKKR